MRILMLGNSLTFANDMPSMLAEITGAEVVHHTRGGARLAEQLNPKTQMGEKTKAALENESWDYVVLQEMSNGPITARKTFLANAERLCRKIKAAGATPIFYATWAYRRGSEDLNRLGLAYDVMAAQLAEAYRLAAETNEALIAEVGKRFYELADSRNFYAEDGQHPNETGSRIAAETIAAVIIADQDKKRSEAVRMEITKKVGESDMRLRILYMYQLLLKYTDQDHPLTTNQIRALMEKEHGLTMHRTTVSSDVELLNYAGYPIHVKRSRANKYYLEEGQFQLAELKVLIDAVESSKFITEKKSAELVEKLTRLTSETNAEDLKRHLYPSGRVKSGNEKGYYIVDAINSAINSGKRISFLYTDYNMKKQQILRNEGNPYTVSPYALVWNGDYYYLVGWYHEKERMNTFRVDRILTQPTVLKEDAEPQPEDFDISKYTREVFRMYDTQETAEVTLLCDSSVMRGIIDKFGEDVRIRARDESHFAATVSVCPSPTFYGWVFQWGGLIKIEGPADVKEGYFEMARQAFNLPGKQSRKKGS